MKMHKGSEMKSGKYRLLMVAVIAGWLLTACTANPIEPAGPTAPTAAGAAPTIGAPTATPISAPPNDSTSIPPTPTPTPAPTEPPATVVALKCDGLTPAQTEGPYYTPDTPERTSLIEPGMTGTKLILTGYVLDANCQPIANAWLDFWQADAAGAYDNAGYVMRGHQFTDADGRYQLETMLPGLYPGRTRHIHVKVQAPGGPVLTSQIYFPGEAANASDQIFDPALIAEVETTADGLRGAFNFVINPK